MNKTLIALALSLGLGLAGCSQNASDQPENATANAPDTAAPYDSTAAATAPSGNDSADATANTTGVNPSTDTTGDATAMGTATDASGNAMGTDSAMGGTTTGGNSQYSANLEEELRRCDQLSGAERDTCRTDAQNRYDQSNTSTPTTP
jgi:hypothetical protein